MRDRDRAARLLASLSLALGLAACAGLAREPAPGDAPSPASAASAANSGAAHAAYRLEVEAPGNLRVLLQTYLDLARFQSATEAEGITAGELDRLAAATPAQARSLLETEGYFNARVVVERARDGDGTPLLRVKVETGPRVRVAAWDLSAEGALQEAAVRGEAGARDLMARLRSAWPMKEGEPFRQPAWTAAKNAALAELRAEGYTAAGWARTEARVDARTQQVTLVAVIQSGPLFRFGELHIEGLSRYDEGAVRNVADFSVGTPFTEKRLLDFQERLTKVGLFETVSVEIDPDPAKAAATPVTVKVREVILQQATTGIGFSDNTGARITLEHRHRRPFGWNVQGYNKFEIGRHLRSWTGELLSNPGRRQYRKLIAAGVSRLDTAEDVNLSSRLRFGRSLDTQQSVRLAYAELLHENVTDASGRRTSAAVSGNYNRVWREVDSIILPTRGLTATIETGLGYARSNFADSGPFGRVRGRITGYLPIGKAWYAQARVEAAQVAAQDAVGIPETLLFRAGGDDSVRGYAYRTLAPTRNGDLTSGRVLLTSSAEIARPISAGLPSVWWALFVDAGNAADHWNELQPALGYGVGLRWRSPVGPLRVDVGHGVETRQTRLHLSVGIAF